jgi:hypothetical protein
LNSGLIVTGSASTSGYNETIIKLAAQRAFSKFAHGLADRATM